MAEELVNFKTDLSAFTTDQILNRLEAKHREILRGKLEKLKQGGKKVRVYCDGVFDCFHVGHARLLEQVKKIIPNVELVVGVCSDADTYREKGIMIMNEEERLESARHCKWTDEVYLPAPWEPTLEFLKSLNCDFIAHDAIPYGSADSADVYAPFKDAGCFLPTLRSEGISTSDIIKRVLSDRDEYFRRSVKKGITPNDLSLDLYECFKFGLRPPQTNFINKIINKVLDIKLITKLSGLRALSVKLICPKKVQKSRFKLKTE
jgi:cytidyltransferase-like protein